ncbi:MAG: carboxypeptidase regulatory-like domain-containing protein, partial [Gemmatimonadaceae bacterium]|nr:carboxypeptidase regulatory-like domain-containing protein [Gemmatimonadaceae bacterium]
MVSSNLAAFASRADWGRSPVGCAILSALLCAAAWMSSAAPASAQGAPHGVERHIHGIVEDSITGRAIEGAEVVVEAPSSLRAATPTVCRKRTDGKGRFDFLDLPAVVVVVRVRAIGYAQDVRRLDLTDSDRLITVHL